ncbi:MAG: Maf family protein [Eubacteriales bacterium]|nr:Maf family protein [Eubacteriales bacterium]
MRKIVLASASPRRAALMKQIGIEFEIAIPEINEDLNIDNEPVEVVQKISRSKAEDIAHRTGEDAVIIAADTVVVCDGRILGKPADACEAEEMLRLLEGRKHEVITGFTIIDNSKDKRIITSYEVTGVKMRKLDDIEIQAYLNTGEPFDKAGAYAIQGVGALLVDEIKGCYFNVMGFPLSKIAHVLEGIGISLLRMQANL